MMREGEGTARPTGDVSLQLISVILPIQNQADHLRALIEKYEAALSTLPLPTEVILVVNGSADASITIARELEQRYQSVRVFHSERGQWGHAVRLGLRAARGGLLCFTNSARTNAQDLMRVLEYALAHPGIVITAKRPMREKFHRRLARISHGCRYKRLPVMA